MCENSVFKLPLITLFIHSNVNPCLSDEKIIKEGKGEEEVEEKKRFTRINKMNHHIFCGWAFSGFRAHPERAQSWLRLLLRPATVLVLTELTLRH